MPAILPVLALSAVAIVAIAGGAWAASLANVESNIFTIRDFKLEKGQILPEVKIAYETYGRLDASGRNAVLMTHGYTSSHHAAGRYAAGKAAQGTADDELGWYDKLIGPGKPIDTEKLFVVSSNMLGSSFGSTNPASINPATGKPYGPDFPEITMVDIVNAQKKLLDSLAVKHLVAVVGGSFGGYQALQWAVTYPGYMDGIVATVTAPKGSGGEASVQNLIARLAKDPNWNNGWYYEKGGIPIALAEIRVATLKQYGINEQLAEKGIPEGAAREDAIRQAAEPWVRNFDGNSLVVLRRAAANYDAEKDFHKIKAKVLYVISTTDKLFPPSIVPGVMEKLKAAGVDATYFELVSDKGHLAAGADADKWAPSLREFMARLNGG